MEIAFKHQVTGVLFDSRPQIVICNNVVCWHRKMGNLVSIVTKTKLRSGCRPWIKDRFNGVQVFTSGLDAGFFGAGVAIIMDVSLAQHVSKISEVPSRLLSIKLLFKNKLSVSILELYAGASSVVWFSQAGDINSLIAKAVNESSFIILGGDFNEDGSHKCVSFKKCLDLGLVNSLVGSPAVKKPTWMNSRGIRKTINYMLITDLFLCLWVWINFKGAMLANAAMFLDEFAATTGFSDLDTMWDVVCKIMVLLANEVFKKKWFKDYNGVFTKKSSKFHKLELLVSRLVKASQSTCYNEFILLLDVWDSLDNDNASMVRSFFFSGSSFDTICVLECPFCKVILDHLVVNDELILEPGLVKSKIDKIMEGWTRKYRVVSDILEEWHHQYRPLCYVFDKAFWSVMQPIEFLELFSMVSNLPDGKAAGLSGISNKLWKHYNRSVLDMLLMLLNSCLFCEFVLALIETAHKIFSKIFSDRISLACSTYNILCGDNFSVLKGTTTQTLIFAIGSVVKDALEKDWELWLVLQNMRKVYDSVGWEHLKKCLVRIKMYGKFIWFFGNIHRNWTNWIMTDFGLSDGYHVHDELDQGEVFLSLLWCIFYDLLLCKVKHQESVCSYRFNSHFVFRSGRTESQAGLSSFFAAGVFVDNTIWVGSSQAATQHILNIASEFFQINDILINNDKTVIISINSRISNPSLFISGSPIFIAKKGKSHWYFGIFLLTDGLSKSSLAKTHLDIYFFSNLVLRKVVSDKQFLYLVLAVFHPIISYRTQFSFISVGVCNKWNTLICKSLKLKSDFSLDFPSDIIHYLSFYGLKFFSQCQSESKIASLISFVNSHGVLGQLFSHRSHDLQVLSWCPIYLLNSLAYVCVSAFNNFLSSVVHILLDCNLFLGGSLASSFWLHDGVLMSTVLGESLFFKFLPFLRHYDIAFVDQLCNCHEDVFNWYTFKWWKRLNFYGPVPEWFKLSVAFLGGLPPSSSALIGVSPLNICESSDFVSVRDHLSQVGFGSLSVYTDGSLKNLGMLDCRGGTAVFFEDINLGLDVSVCGLVLSTLVELQTIALALECMPKSHSVHLFSDSQAALDACKSKLGLMCPDFHNQCWVKHQHIRNVIYSKNLKVSWHKVKGHSGILGNKCADGLADAASLFGWSLPLCVSKHFLVMDGGIVLGNSRHFVQDVFQAVCYVHWEVGSGSSFLVDGLLSDFNWLRSFWMWHPDLYMTTGFTSRCIADSSVWKHLYNKCYPNVLCLYCEEVEISDHVFSCTRVILERTFGSLSFLFMCVAVVVNLHSEFLGVISSAVSVFYDPKIAGVRITDFTHSLCLTFRDNIWLVHAKHYAFMEKHGLIPMDGSAPTSISGSALKFSTGVVKLFGMSKAFRVCFGFHKHCLFFSGINSLVSVVIIA
ncbi:hypothetical protein G9A89_016573 [Geosiphon pyriformis]|nr:hypothetical protein G9A89_016573 [Geosiphon pyriformis]